MTAKLRHTGLSVPPPAALLTLPARPIIVQRLRFSGKIFGKVNKHVVMRMGCVSRRTKIKKAIRLIVYKRLPLSESQTT